MLVAQRPGKTERKTLSCLNEAVNLVGGHLYCDQDENFSIGGVVDRVTEGGDHLWIETKQSPEHKTTRGIALSTKHCEWSREVYMQCEIGTFGCITIHDPINSKDYHVHGVRLYS